MVISPANTNKNKRSGGNRVKTSPSAVTADSIRVTGILALGSVLSNIATGAGAILADIVVAPSAFPDSQLGRRAALWQRYRVNRARVVYTSSVPQSVNCNLVGYWEPDPTTSASLENSLNVGLGHKGAKQMGANQRWSLSVPCPKDWLFTAAEGEKRLYEMGRAVILQRQAPVDFNGQVVAGDIPLGDLTLEWDITFKESQVSPPLLSTSDMAKVSIGIGASQKRFIMPSTGVFASLGEVDDVTTSGDVAVKVSDSSGSTNTTYELLSGAVAKSHVISDPYGGRGTLLVEPGATVYSRFPLVEVGSSGTQKTTVPPTETPSPSSQLEILTRLTDALGRLVSQNSLAGGNSIKAEERAPSPTPSVCQTCFSKDCYVFRLRREDSETARLLSSSAERDWECDCSEDDCAFGPTTRTGQDEVDGPSLYSC